jgi:hypothetical protein
LSEFGSTKSQKEEVKIIPYFGRNLEDELSVISGWGFRGRIKVYIVQKRRMRALVREEVKIFCCPPTEQATTQQCTAFSYIISSYVWWTM